MIKPYSRDSAFFRSLRDRNMTIAHRDLDNNFNNIINYLSSELLPVIDMLANRKVVGVIDFKDHFLRNIGDGTTKFDIIRSSDLTDNTLTLDRFIQVAPNSILATNNSENIRPIATNGLVDDEALVSNINNLPNWQKLTFNNFENSSITSNVIALGTLSARHLTAGIIGKPLAEQSIETRYIQDRTITLNKILDNSISSEKISATLMATRVAAQHLKFKDKCFSARTIQDNSFNFMQACTRSGAIKMRGILNPKSIPINAVRLVTNSIDDKINVRKQMDKTILQSSIRDGSLDLPAIMASANITVSNNSSQWQSKPIGKAKLSPEFKSILVNKGGLTA